MQKKNLVFLFLNPYIYVGTQKNRLNMHPKHMLKLMGKKIILQFYTQEFCLSLKNL